MQVYMFAYHTIMVDANITSHHTYWLLQALCFWQLCKDRRGLAVNMLGPPSTHKHVWQTCSCERLNMNIFCQKIKK